MSAHPQPKLLKILQAISDRLQGVRMADGYYTNAGQQVVRGVHSLDHTRLPGFAVYMETRDVVESAKGRARASAAVTIEALAEYADEHPEDVACYLAADIQTAIETTDRTLGGLVLDETGTGGINWQSDEVTYPEDSNNQVGVRVTYLVPHIRRPGDPNN